MKRGVMSLFFVGAFCASSALAQVTVQFPDDYTILAVNGKELKRSKSVLQLPDGENQVLFQVVKELGTGKSVNKDIVRSETFVIKFAAENTQLTLEGPTIRNELEMHKFDRHPRLQLIGKGGGMVPVQCDELSKDGLQLMRDYEEELLAFNKGTSPAAIAALATGSSQNIQGGQFIQGAQTAAQSNVNSSNVQQVPLPTADAQPVAERSAPQSSAVMPSSGKEDKMAQDMLRYWYEQADEKTKEEFLKSIGK